MVIGISHSTKLLLIKRDFQTEYEQLIDECRKSPLHNRLDPVLNNQNETYLLEKKLFYFHQIYSLFLLCVNDYDKLMDLNDQILKTPILEVYQSKMIEFYLLILNILYFRESSITKFVYTTKLYAIVRSLIVRNNLYSIDCTKSFLNYLKLTLIQFKLKNSSMFLNQLLENNDIDLLLNQISVSLAKSKTFSCNSTDFLLGSIFVYLKKIENIIQSNNKPSSTNGPILLASNLGIKHQIRREFDQALRINPKSFQLWFLYLKFETNFNIIERKLLNNSQNDQSDFQNRLLSIYYQSIRNLPNHKVRLIRLS
jgi:hypothetical protein